MTSVSQTPTRTPPAVTPSDSRGRLIAVALLTIVVLGSAGWWTVHRQSHVDVVLTGASPARGISLEADYAPALPATITAASIETDAGKASLYDNSADSDAPPATVAVGIGRSISISGTITPDCTVAHPSDAVTVIMITSAGTRTMNAEVEGLKQAINRICTGPVQVTLTQAHRDGHVVSGTYDTAPTDDRVTLSVQNPKFTAEPLVLVPGGNQVQWTVTTEQGCSVASRPVMAVATYADGRQVPVRLSAPGLGVCGNS
jgi:hypothetical protein